MKKVKVFFLVFEKSFLLCFQYYRKILFSRFSFSLKYFLLLIIFLNFLNITFLAFKFNPFFLKNFLVSINKSLNNIPNNFQVKIINGKLISSYPYPFFLWTDKPKRLLLVIDESAETSKINTYNSIAMFTQDELVIKKNFLINNNNAQNYVFPLKYSENTTINKKNFLNLNLKIDYIIKFFYLFYFFSLLMIFIFRSFFSFLGLFLAILIASFLIHLIFYRFKRKTIHLKKIVQIGFHAITFPLVVEFLIFNFFPEIKINFLNNLSFYFKILLFIFLVFIFNFIGSYLAYIESHHPNHHSHQSHHPSRRK